jgi:hypothetical protein
MFKFTSYPIVVSAAAFGLVALAISPARATPCGVTSTLTESNLAGLGSGDFGTVCITYTGTLLAPGTATVEFTAGPGFAFVDSNIADLNSTTITSVSGLPTHFSDTGPGQVDGFGNFSNTTKYKDASSPFSTITFDIAGTFTAADQVLTANANGFDAAAHIIDNIAGDPNNGKTGYAGECVSNCVIVPAPSIGHGLPVVLVVGGLLLGFKLWERKQNRRSLGTAVPHAAA